jgi:hypothetical protein
MLENEMSGARSMHEIDDKHSNLRHENLKVRGHSED